MDPSKRVGLSLFPEVDRAELVSHASEREVLLQSLGSAKHALLPISSAVHSARLNALCLALGCSFGDSASLQFSGGPLIGDRAK